MESSDRPTGNGHKYRKLHVNARKHIFDVRVIKYGCRMLREFVESPSLESRKI